MIMEEYKPRYFTIRELTISATARNYGINNDPNEAVLDNLLKLCKYVLDPIREMWGGPVYVSSGYRSPELNAKLGTLGHYVAKNSSHMRGLAADIKVGNSDDNRKLFYAIVNSGIPFEKLIDEEDCRWLHISFNPNDQKPKQIVYIGKKGKYTVYKK